MICPHCDKNVPEGLVMCFYCGRLLDCGEPQDSHAVPVQPEITGQQPIAPPPVQKPVHSRQDGRKKKYLAGIVAATIAVLLLGGAAGGHYLGFYTLPLLPEISGADEIILPPPTATPSPTIALPDEISPTPAYTEPPAPAYTEPLAQEYIDIFSGGEYYLRYRTVENNSLFEEAWNGQSRFFRYEGEADDTEYLMTDGARLYFIDHSAGTYMFLFELQNVKLWDSLFRISSGSDEFAGMTLHYEMYWNNYLSYPVQFFFRDGEMYGFRETGVFTEFFIEEVTDTVPHWRFEIPAGYQPAWEEAPSPVTPTPTPSPVTPTPMPTPQSGFRTGTYANNSVIGEFRWSIIFESDGTYLFNYSDAHGSTLITMRGTYWIHENEWTGSINIMLQDSAGFEWVLAYEDGTVVFWEGSDFPEVYWGTRLHLQ